MREKPKATLSGYLFLLLGLGAIAGSVVYMAQNAKGDPKAVLIGIAGIILPIILMKGLFMVAPNEAVVFQLFGRYTGTSRDEGLRWTNPFLSERKISLRVRNFETQHIKVNDIDGNPIEIGAVVVWRVVDTAEACFVVDDYLQYVKVQAEAAVRSLATRYPYDAHDEAHVSLRGHTATIAEELKREMQERLAKAGVDVVEARLQHLAYAPEIAQAMLQRQQAGAIIAARSRIVEGAVGMVKMALEQLSRDGVIEFDADRKAAMVSNLLVVLCGERGTQPVVNTGSIYQ